MTIVRTNDFAMESDGRVVRIRFAAGGEVIVTMQTAISLALALQFITASQHRKDGDTAHVTSHS